MFSKSYCVNLFRKEDRWDKFCTDYPLSSLPERYQAIDKLNVQAPNWFLKSSNGNPTSGAWGCYRSHLRILEDCLNDPSCENVCIFEDDAIFSEDFAERLPLAIKKLPDDWDMFYLGGNLLKRRLYPPEKINKHIWRVFNVNGTFAYAVNRKFMQTLYNHLLSREWRPGHHIDHHYGVIHENKKHKIYVPRPWLCGHGAMGSEIGNYGQNENWFTWNEPLKRNPMVAVVGVFRGGTSCTAGVLHNLGIVMGNYFRRPNTNNPRGFFEAEQLAKICRQSFQEPLMAEKVRRPQRIEMLAEWAANMRDKHKWCGGKHPTLSLMVPDIIDAWGRDTKFIAVDRDIQKVLASLQKLKWGWCDTAKQHTCPTMYARRDKDLESVSSNNILRIQYETLVSSPEKVVQEICSFLEYSPTEDQLEKAISHIDLS